MIGIVGHEMKVVLTQQPEAVVLQCGQGGSGGLHVFGGGAAVILPLAEVR